jgi:hypothetical protein
MRAAEQIARLSGEDITIGVSIDEQLMVRSNNLEKFHTFKRELERAFRDPAFRPPRAPRKPSLKQIEQQAGRPVASVTIAPDGSRTYSFGAATEATTDTNPWNKLYA